MYKKWRRKQRVMFILCGIAAFVGMITILTMLLLPEEDVIAPLERPPVDAQPLPRGESADVTDVPTAPLYTPLNESEVKDALPTDVDSFMSPHVPHMGQEPPHLDVGDGSRRYRNPYHPLRRTGRPCDAKRVKEGRWVYNRSRRPLYASRGKILGCCEGTFKKEGSVGGVRRETQYEWVPDTCDLVAWDEELFCRALRGRSIMMAGDSLTDHWHASLYYLLGGVGDIYHREGTARGLRRCQGHAICQKYYPNNSVKLMFLTNQFLQATHKSNRNYPWWKYIHKYPILILNSGAWMVRPENEHKSVSDEMFYEYMRRAAGIVRRLYKGTVIWRTTFRGHPYCWEYDKPLDKLLEPHQYVGGVYTRYRWNAIPARNNYTTSLWQDMGAHILDIAPMTDRMPLGHLGKSHYKFATTNATDCLHYCSPGAVYDYWSTHLMNLLIGNIDD